MSIFSRIENMSLPKAYNNCRCSCHSMSGVKHCVPCCVPGINDKINNIRKLDFNKLSK